MPVDLLNDPRWKAEHLGLPLPDDAHAVSACLPLWSHNIGYEEGDPKVVDRLQAAYPRFCLHPLVARLCKTVIDTPQRRGLPFVSPAAAQRAAEYAACHGVSDIQLRPLDHQRITAVTVPAGHFSILKQYWQHAGENVSSRAARQILDGQTVTFTETEQRRSVRKKVASLHDLSEGSVFLTSCGMSAVTAGWRAVRSFAADGLAGHTSRRLLTCQFGFPYVDTLKIQQRFPQSDHVFFPAGDSRDLEKLRQQCRENPPHAVFCEVPTNPLLRTPDLAALRRLADEYKMLLIVDDTLGACLNLNVIPYADLVVTSLTKYFSGYGNVLAGALIINERRPFAQSLRQIVENEFEETLCDADAEVLCTNSQDLEERVARINATTLDIVSFLKSHPAVDRIYYPDEDDAAYQQIARRGAGRGGLFSILLRNPEQTTAPFFDQLRICKGPNLGTNFTLCCPYTILAHYHELDEVERQGVSRWLLRVSVGTESADDLIERFSTALPR